MLASTSMALGHADKPTVRSCTTPLSLDTEPKRASLGRSVVLDIDLAAAPPPPATGGGLDAARKAWLPPRLGSAGWELNAAGRPGPRMADLSSVLDPTRLAENSVRLNIKLMRWRALPDLDVELLSRTKCLLLGAGAIVALFARRRHRGGELP